MVTGALVRLRAPEPADAESFYAWFNDPEATAGLGVRYPVPLRVEQEWVERNAVPSYAGAHFAVETLDGRLLGTCGLFGTRLPENRCAELGVALVDKTQWGNGYGTDTVRTLCRFGFEEMNLHRIELLVFAHHTRAIAVYEKAGFVRECVAREAHWGDGRWYDDVHMSLLEGGLR
jgi:RimJ/RimL family protein N-acetyltransferase